MARKGRRDRRAARLQREAGRSRATEPATINWITRETRIKKSGVRDVFTPHQPVSVLDLLFGRQDEVQSLVETINTPGQHVLLYGERGVGKSSLANVVGLLVDLSMGKPVLNKRCDSQDTFESILRKPLAAVGIDLDRAEVTTSRGSSQTLGSEGLGAAISASRQVVETYRTRGALSPSLVGDAIAGLEGVFIVDEADAIRKSEDRQRLAELIKYLSDEASALKVMVVGIAATGSELTAAHPSVARCLREVKLRRMRDAELQEIVTSGATALQLSFSPEAVTAIVKLSSGYPHFTHLLALKCAEDAVAEERKSINVDHLKAAMQRAVADAEGTLTRVYADSVRSLASDMYRYILMACATLGTEEFTSAELRAAIARVTGKEITQYSLNNYLQRLVTRDGTTILRRTGQGHYRFEDPRMASYVSIYNEMI